MTEIEVPWAREVIGNLIQEYKIPVPRKFFLASKYDVATIPALCYISVEIWRIHYDYQNQVR